VQTIHFFRGSCRAHTQILDITSSGFPSTPLKLPAIDSFSYFHVANASFLLVTPISSRRVLSERCFQEAILLPKYLKEKYYFSAIS
jgi:hypothetical protein